MRNTPNALILTKHMLNDVLRNVIELVITIQCRLVENTPFDSAQGDSHPERSRRVHSD